MDELLRRPPPKIIESEVGADSPMRPIEPEPRKDAEAVLGLKSSAGSDNQWRSVVTRGGAEALSIKAVQQVKLREFCKQNGIDDADKIDINADYKFAHPTGRVESGWRVQKLLGDSISLFHETEIEAKASKNYAGLLAVMPGTSAEHVKAIEQTLKEVPPHILDFLTKSGYKILAAPRITSALPHLQGVQPRGWSGKTFDNSDGTMDELRKLIVSPGEFKHKDQWLKNGRPDVVSHQIGHAIDAILKNYSSSEAFQKVYVRDMENIPSKDRNHIYKYLAQGEGAGQKEAYACIFGMLLTGPENPEDRPYFEKYFANTISVLKQQIKSLK